MNVEKVRDRFLFFQEQTNCTRQTAPDKLHQTNCTRQTAPDKLHQAHAPITRRRSFWPLDRRSYYSDLPHRPVRCTSQTVIPPNRTTQSRVLLPAQSVAGSHFLFLEQTKCKLHQMFNVRLTSHRLVRSPAVEPWKFPGLKKKLQKARSLRLFFLLRNLNLLSLSIPDTCAHDDDTTTKRQGALHFV